MYNPTLRLLTLLELLQAREHVGAAELAQRLEVDPRSVRRYIMMLQDLGIPIESTRGRYGAYRLRPGFKLPPLMLTEEEAIAVMLGLLTLQTNGLAFATPSVEGASAKLARVLPARLREKVQVLQQVVVFGPEKRYVSLTTSGERILQVSEAVYKRQRVWLCYRSKKGEQTERLVDPYGIAYWAGCWYMVGYCHLRKSVRAYRLDRMIQADIQPEQFESPAHFDCVDYLIHSFGTSVPSWEVEVLLKADLSEIQKKILITYGSLEAQENGVMYRSHVDDLADTARFLVDLRCPFVVSRPAELQTALHQLAQEIHQLAEQHLP